MQALTLTVCWTILAVGVVGTASAFPIRTTSPGTGVFEGTVAVGRGIFIKKSEGSAKSSVFNIPVVANYSPTTNTALGLTVPYVYKSLERPGREKQSTEGLGDVLLRGKYRFHKTVGLRRRTQAAFQVGLKIPTGETDRDVDQSLSAVEQRSLQPGTGSYDFVFDISYSKQVKRASIGGNVAYRYNSEDDDVKFGNQLTANLDLEYILLPVKYPGNELVLILETTYLDTRENEFQKNKVSSGGDEVFLAPGVQYIPAENLLLEGSFQFPVFQDTEGTAPKVDYSILFGFRYIW